MSHPLNVLVVCRANVCRSPFGSELITRYSQRAGLSGVIVARSAGTDALDELPMCAQALDRLADSPAHLAAELTYADLLSADLILAVDRESRAACAILDPGCRPHLFTLRQAAFLASNAEGESSALTDQADRLRWLVGEWDAQRALLAGRDEDADDIVDRHGPAPHAEVFDGIDEACEAIVAGFARYVAAEPI